MRTRSSTLRNREEPEGITIPSSTSEYGNRPDIVPPTTLIGGGNNGVTGRLGNLTRSRPIDDDLRGSTTPMGVSNDFNNELQRLAIQNLQLKRGQRPPSGPDMASGRSSSFCSGVPGCSGRSCPLKTPTTGFRRETLASTSSGLRGEPPTPTAWRSNVLETIARAFPITIPTDEFVNFIDSKGSPDLTEDVKRYFEERNGQHRNEFEQYVNVFKSERPWEPKWFTSFLYKLFVSTKSRPNVYQYIFDVKERREESKYIQKWRDQSGYFKWALYVTAFLTYIVMICFLIEMYDEEGINMAVPVTLFITILINKVLVNLNSSLPDGI